MKYINFFIAIALLSGINFAFGFGGQEDDGVNQKARKLLELDNEFQDLFEQSMKTNNRIRVVYQHHQGVKDWESKPINYYADEDIDDDLISIQKESLRNNFLKQQHLVKKGAFVDTTKSPYEPEFYEDNLCTAIREADIAYVQLLLEHGAQSLHGGAGNYDVFTSRNKEIFKLLIQYGLITLQQIRKMKPLDEMFIYPIYAQAKAEYGEYQENWENTFLAMQISLTRKGVNRDARQYFSKFCDPFPEFTFEEITHMKGMLAVMQKLIQRMQFLGLRVIECPLSDSKELGYKVIDEYEVSAPTSASASVSARSDDSSTTEEDVTRGGLEDMTEETDDSETPL